MSLPRSEATDKLFETFLTLKDLDECYRYFEDLCTIKEVLTMSQRFEVAKRLADGESYLKVTEDTGVSSATVGRVKRALDYGTGGYKMVMDREKSGS